MSQFRRIAFSTALVAVTVIAGLTMGGCHKLAALTGRTAEAPKPKAPVVPVKTGPVAPAIDYAKVRPNELGRIPVIMYHEILPTSGKPLTRTIDAFKKDLETMHAAGFVPVNLSDAVTGNISVPAGKSPIVLTFDDARASQFKLVETADSMQVDPNCAVGLLQAFCKAHPDFPLHATFFVLPKSKVTMEPFGQLGMGGQKFAYLAQNGMEIGNHTTTHHSLRGMTPEQIQAEIGNANKAIMEEFPDAKIQVFAVPMGMFPRNKKNYAYLAKGSYQGAAYEFKGVMDAAWRPMPSPAAKDFDPLRLPRIDCIDGTNGAGYWIKKLTDGTAMYRRYVSDGDPNVVSFPKGEESQANLPKLKAEGKLVNVYSPFGGVGGAKPIVSAATEPAPGATSSAAPDGSPKPIVGAEALPATPVPSASGGATITEKPIR